MLLINSNRKVAKKKQNESKIWEFGMCKRNVKNWGNFVYSRRILNSGCFPTLSEFSPFFKDVGTGNQ